MILPRSSGLNFSATAMTKEDTPAKTPSAAGIAATSVESRSDFRVIAAPTVYHVTQEHRGIAADILEAVMNPSVPASIAGNEDWIVWAEKRAGRNGELFRPARRDNVVSCLKSALAYASRVPDDSPDMVRFRQCLGIYIHNLELIHFPGMSGR